jgi:hypothetical protein
MKSFAIIIVLLPSILLRAQDSRVKKIFSLISPEATGIQFRNDIIEDGNMFYYKYEYLYIGAGVAVGDINNDGLQDLYFASTLGANKLYLNLGNFQFRDITDQAGVSAASGMKTGVNMIDINNDGWLDILVCKSGPTDATARTKHLYINNGTSSLSGEGRGEVTFTDKAKEYGLNDASFTTQAYFLDYDKDGDMDVYFANQPKDFTTAMLIPAKLVNGKMVYAEDTATVYVSDRLYQNNRGKFTDVTKKAGLINHAFALSAVIYDFNNDGWPDIYVANDFNKPDFLYINNRNGTFTEKLSDHLHHVSLSSMGSDMNDINNDGLEDLFVLDMAIEDPVRQKQLFVQNLNYDKFQLLLRFKLFYQYPRNCLQLNNGDGSFSDIAYYSGTAQTDWSWTPLIADYDNDGWKDIYVTNGLKRDITDWDYKNFVLDSIKNLMARGISVQLDDWFKLIPQTKVKNYFYRNNGTLKFDNNSDPWCDQLPSFSNGAVFADLDNDGDLDLVVNNIDDPAFVYKNNSREMNNSNYLRFRFLKNKTSSEEIYGTVVKVYNGVGEMQLNRYDPQRGYMGTMEHFLHFGLGKMSMIPNATIIFPSGKTIVLQNITANQLLTVYESDGAATGASLQNKKKLFEKAANRSLFNYTHQENDFIDFKREPLIPFKCSRKGPYFAKADVNGDGKEDMYISGAAGNEGTLLIQGAGERFTKKIQAAFIKDKAFEDGGAVFFDADGDKDSDLYVVSGGAEFNAGSARYQDRLYINDGKGNFTRASTALPGETFNGSVVITLDYDDDGDNDLFVGGGVVPGRFPQPDKNILLQNNRGVFKNVTDALAPELNKTGIVNHAAWEDVDGDKKNELVLAGEWMPVMIFSWKQGKFAKANATAAVSQKIISLDQLTGWWNVVKAADIDNDGDMDLIAGNRGMNSKISASLDGPCMVYAKDFDGNGSYDAVLGYYIWGKCYPMYHRDQLIDQLPMMRKKFIRYSHYAGKTMDEIFTGEQKKDMDIFTTASFESGVLVNEGNFSFCFIPFPERAQLSTVNDLIIEDWDGDGIKDILIGGNSYDPDVSTGNYDACAAWLLKGDGIGNFTPLNPGESGIITNGEVRRIIYLPDKKQIFLLRNNAATEVFSAN